MPSKNQHDAALPVATALPRPVAGRKISAKPLDALGALKDGTTIVVGGFGDSGIPFGLLDAVHALGTRGLTVISINAGRGSSGIAALISSGQVDRIICSFPRTAGSSVFEQSYLANRIALELVPMGTLVERLRAGAAGIPAFYTAVGVGTRLQDGKPVRDFNGQTHVLEFALRADLALIRAHRSDTFGNLTYRGVDRNLNPVAAKAARFTIAEVDEVVELGTIAPDTVVTPGLYVDRIVLAPTAISDHG
jgi:3-oxoadipate CoA-transferase alpha subunit